MRTSSATRSSARNSVTVVRAGLVEASLAMRKWLAASEAIWGRWVMQMTCRAAARARSCSPTARAVGEQLRALAAARQVLCITHLPQIASLAQRHFRIAKNASTSPARTTVTELRADDLVAELVRMLGADEADLAARRHAKQLLAAA